MRDITHIELAKSVSQKLQEFQESICGEPSLSEGLSQHDIETLDEVHNILYRYIEYQRSL